MFFGKKATQAAFVFVLLSSQSILFSMNSMDMHTNSSKIIESADELVNNENEITRTNSSIITRAFEKIKNGLFSFENQQIFSLSLIILPFIADIKKYTSFTSKPLTPIPLNVQATCTKMGFDLKPNKIFVSPTLPTAGATYDAVYLNEKFLDKYTPEQVEYIIGHEIAHIQLKHHLKWVAFVALFTITPIIAEALIKLIEKKYKPAAGTTLYKTFEVCKKAQEVVFENPLIWAILFKIASAAFNRYQEKQADLLSVEKTGQINGAITCNEKWIKADMQKKQSETWLSYLNPLTIISNINHVLFPTHPSLETQADYLKALKKA